MGVNRQQRTHSAYRRDNARLKKQSAICWICGEPIDRNLKWPDPRSWSADHVTPLAKGGDIMGKRLPAHLSCNSRRQDGGRDLNTTRSW